MKNFPKSSFLEALVHQNCFLKTAQKKKEWKKHPLNISRQHFKSKWNFFWEKDPHQSHMSQKSQNELIITHQIPPKPSDLSCYSQSYIYPPLYTIFSFVSILINIGETSEAKSILTWNPTESFIKSSKLWTSNSVQ